MTLKSYVLNKQICAHTTNAAHAMEVPPNARLLFCNGQVGAGKDASVPDDPSQQIRIIFERIGAILTAAAMDFSDIVRLTVYVTNASIFETYFQHRAAIMGAHNPPAVLLIVDAFPRPGVVVEIEAVAAKTD